jgi:tetratricopeptide (TPR) repeat protein
MIHNFKFFISAFLLVLSFTILAQNQQKIDSLLKVLKTTGKDTNAVNIYNDLCKEYCNNDAEKAMQYANLGLELSNKINDKKGLSICYKNIGQINSNQGNFNEAIDYYTKSLKTDKEQGNKEGIGLSYKYIGIIFYRQCKYDTAIEYYNKALKIFEELANKKEISKCYNNIAVIYHREGDFEKALELYQKSLELAIELSSKKDIAKCNSNIGYVYNDQGNYKEAMVCFFGSLKIYEELGDKLNISVCFSNIADVLESIKLYDKALSYYQKTLYIANEIGDSLGISDAFNNIGVVYADLKDNGKALECYQKSLIFRKKIDDKKGIVECLNNIGLVYLDEKNYNKALENFKEILKLCKELGLQYNISVCLDNIALIKIKQKKYLEAIDFAKQSLAISKEMGLLDDQKIAYEDLSASYGNLGDYKNAYEYHILFKQIYDSIYNEKSIKQVKVLETQYQFEKKQLEIDNLNKDKKLKEAQIAIQKNIIFAIILGVIILILISAIIIFRYTHKLKLKEIRTRNELMEELNEERQKTLSQQMNPHFLFNIMTAIQCCIMENDKNTAIDYVSKLARLMRTGLDFSRKEYNSVESAVDFFSDYVKLKSIGLKEEIKLHVNIDENIDKEKYKIPPMIVQPFIENAIVHGLIPRNQDMQLNVDIKQKNGNLIFTIEDNGIGRKHAGEISEKKNSFHKSYGIEITEERVELLNKVNKGNTKINIQDLKDINGNAKGTRVLINFPIMV